MWHADLELHVHSNEKELDVLKMAEAHAKNAIFGKGRVLVDVKPLSSTEGFCHCPGSSKGMKLYQIILYWESGNPFHKNKV